MGVDRLIATVIGLSLCVVPGGCTIVQIDGPARISTAKFGVLRIEPVNDVDTVVYHTRGIGLVPGRDGVTLGASNETAALIYGRDTCRIILFEPKPEAVAELADILKNAGSSIGEVCTTGERK